MPPPVRVPDAVVGSIPELCQRFHGVGLAAVELVEKLRVHRPAPAGAPPGRDPQCLCQQVLLGVDQIDQPPQTCRGVLPQPHVDVDAAGGVGLRAGPRRRARTTSWTIPISSQRHTGLTTSAQGSVTDPSRSTVQWRPSGMGTCQSSQMPPHVQGRGAEVCCDGPRRPFAAETCGFDLDTEGLGFHGVPSLFARRFFSACGGFWFLPFSGRDTFITPPGRKSNPMKSTRFSGKISSDPTKKSGRKTPLPYKAKTGIFSPAAPQKSAPRQKNRRRAPRARADLPPCARPAAAAPPAARRIWPRVPPRRPARPAAGQPPARRRPAPAAGPLCPHRRRPRFCRAAARPRPPSPGGKPPPRPRARRAPRRPAAAPPARKKKRAARAAPPAVPAPRPPAERPAPPRGDRIPGRGFEGTAAPSRVNFREIRDPGYRPKNQKTPEKIRRKKEKQLPRCGQMPQMAR